MYFVYILESVLFGRWYIGSTQDIESRLKQHNAGRVRSSKPYRPYKIVYTESCQTRSEAMCKEREIKRSGVIRQNIKAQFKNNH